MSRHTTSIQATTGARHFDTISTRSSFLQLVGTIKHTKRFDDVWSDSNLLRRHKKRRARLDLRDNSTRLPSRFLDFCADLSLSPVMPEQRLRSAMIFLVSANQDETILS